MNAPRAIANENYARMRPVVAGVVVRGLPSVSLVLVLVLIITGGAG